LALSQASKQVLCATNDNMFVCPADIGPTVNDWLGRSQYNDAAFNGAIDEFRIYNGPLSPLQVALNAATGPAQNITDPGTLQSLELSLGTNAVYYGGKFVSVNAVLLAKFQNVSNVNVGIVPGAAFQSSDETIATISAQGLITATGVGRVTFTGSYGGMSNTLTTTVNTPPDYFVPTLVHRYSFNDATNSTTVKDSVGGADGTIKGLGATWDGNGQLTLPGGGSSAADPSVITAYVDLLNHLFMNTLTNFTIETWVTWQGSSIWQRIFDFGTSAGGEDISNGSGSYQFLSPMAPAAMRYSVRSPITGGEPSPLTSANPLTANVEVLVTITYDFANNVARLYSNTVVVASGTAPVDVSTIDDVNNWLGRSQWGDDMFRGKYNELRIWNGILLPNQIATHYAADSLTLSV
jgi:hypothetical protein